MSVKLLNEHYLEFLHLKGGCRGSSESTHVKMPYYMSLATRQHFVPHVSDMVIYLICSMSSLDTGFLLKTKMHWHWGE